MTKQERKKWKRMQTLYELMKETLCQIATSGKNSTRDRRNARAAVDFVVEMERMPYKHE
jgi:hypothetical protein